MKTNFLKRLIEIGILVAILPGFLGCTKKIDPGINNKLLTIFQDFKPSSQYCVVTDTEGNLLATQAINDTVAYIQMNDLQTSLVNVHLFNYYPSSMAPDWYLLNSYIGISPDVLDLSIQEYQCQGVKSGSLTVKGVKNSTRYIYDFGYGNKEDVFWNGSESRDEVTYNFGGTRKACDHIYFFRESPPSYYFKRDESSAINLVVDVNKDFSTDMSSITIKTPDVSLLEFYGYFEADINSQRVGLAQFCDQCDSREIVKYYYPDNGIFNYYSLTRTTKSKDGRTEFKSRTFGSKPQYPDLFDINWEVQDSTFNELKVSTDQQLSFMSYRFSGKNSNRDDITWVVSSNHLEVDHNMFPPIPEEISSWQPQFALDSFKVNTSLTRLVLEVSDGYNYKRISKFQF